MSSFTVLVVAVSLFSPAASMTIVPFLPVSEATVTFLSVAEMSTVAFSTTRASTELSPLTVQTAFSLKVSVLLPLSAVDFSMFAWPVRKESLPLKVSGMEAFF